ncbi:MAG: hypothetical protein JSS56_17665 [Proteobacteria bacterium]|nr:hypothetical protein [Pseudomonadota bacterium]
MAMQPAFNIADSVMVDAVVRGDDDLVFLAHSEASLDADSPVSQLVRWTGGNWILLGSWPWQGVGLANAGLGDVEDWVVLGRDGEVGRLGRGMSSVDQNDDTLGPFRGLTRLGDRVFAFGMKREVFELESGDRWVRRMEGLEPEDEDEDDRPARKKRLGGLNAVALDAGGVLTAVGMRGEIWMRTGDRWRACDSPTNVMLKDVCLGGDGKLHACGLAGTLLSGAGSTWRVVDYQGAEELDFCAIAWFGDALYLADGHSVRRLIGETLELVDFGVDAIVPAARLVCGASTLLAVAGQEVWQSMDGYAWRSVLG